MTRRGLSSMPALIGRVIASLDSHAGALPCLPVTDTLLRADAGRATGTLPRDGLVARADAARLPLRCDPCRASRRGEGRRATFTDDAGIAQWYGLDVALVEGSEANRKLTSAEDIASADELLAASGASRRSARSAWPPATTCMPSVPAMR